MAVSVVALPVMKTTGVRASSSRSLRKTSSPVWSGRLDVQDHHVGPALGRQRQAFGAGFGREHLQPVIAEGAAEGQQDGRLVIDDQQRRHAPPPAAG